MKLALLLLLLLLVVVAAVVVSAQQPRQNKRRTKPRPTRREQLGIGNYERFWKYHQVREELLVDGENQYHNIKNCIETTLTPQDLQEMKTLTAKDLRKVKQKYVEPDLLDDEIYEEKVVYAVVLENAMLPIHVKAVQTLAKCVRTHIPKLYESRAMYQEMELDEDNGMGGNCPTHLAPLVALFLPSVRKEMQQTLELAFEAAHWQHLVEKDEFLLEEYPDEIFFHEAIPKPEHAGIRASEHLTYSDFPMLADHTDGTTCYTMNYAFVGPDEYEGGEFTINNLSDGTRTLIKPNKYDAIVFLGGRYYHGVNEIKPGGHREMFSTELWPYPDLPFGSTLWTASPGNMEEYIDLCNKEQTGDMNTPCTVSFSTKTWSDNDVNNVKDKYSSSEQAGGGANNKAQQQDQRRQEQQDSQQGKQQSQGHDDNRPNRIRPMPLTPIRFRDVNNNGKEYDMSDFRSPDEEPDFVVPKKLDAGEMVPIRWRDNLRPVGGSEGESLVIGFPSELKHEFKKYIENNGMKKVAQKLLYDEKFLEVGEHRIYTLDDGMKWGAMIQGNWETDMVWLDPANEATFESLLGVLKRGNFDIVLDAVGKAFDLQGLMVQGVGAIFLSEYEVSDNLHIDIPGSKGSFYNVIVPVHIPVNEEAHFYLGDDDEREGKLKLSPDVGVVLGGESYHGTGECNYRKNKDFRLSFAVYVADISEDNIDLIASDSTSLWPTEGDAEWFRAQQGRLWSKDGDRSLKNDKGRKPLPVEDQLPDCPNKKHLCESDPQGVRLKCPKTCELYMEDEAYYALFGGSNPTCQSNTASE